MISIKIVFDFLFSFFLLVFLFPLLFIIAIGIKIDSKGPVLFKQERLGKNGKKFILYKFRTMVVGAEKMGSGVYSKKDDPRITRVGNFLRKTSLDELPQLINIIKGEMSFVGPRPVLTYHPFKFEDYSEEQKKRFKMHPGVTGLAQIQGRKTIPWEKRIKYDLEYIKRFKKEGIALDIKILIVTVIKVLKNEDNYNLEAGSDKYEKN